MMRYPKYQLTLLALVMVPICADAQPVPNNDYRSVNLTEVAIQEQAQSFLSRTGLGKLDVKTVQSVLRQVWLKSFSPELWSDVENGRADFIWLPEYLVSDEIKATLNIQIKKRPICQQFNQSLDKCITIVQTATERAPRGEGLSVCQTFRSVQNVTPREFEGACEPLVMTFQLRGYIRVVLMRPPPVRGGEEGPPVIPKDAIVFNYKLTSTNRSAIMSQARVAEFLDGLAKANVSPPLSLAVDRGDADNFLVARTGMRFSNSLKAYEKITITLATKTTAVTDAPGNPLLTIRTTAHLFLRVNEDNVDLSYKWHDLTDLQRSTYEGLLSQSVVGELRTQCNQLAKTIGPTKFTSNLGATIDVECAAH